jgi:TolB protein
MARRARQKADRVGRYNPAAMRRVLYAIGCVALSGFAVASQSVEPQTSRRIVFLCTRSGVDNLCTIDPQTGDVLQITNGGDSKGAPRWSPDRRSIAFHQQANGASDIFVMNADGTNVRKITTADAVTSYRNPAWSPDGRQLAVECGKPPLWEICIVPLGGSAAPRTLTNGSHAGYSSESPDWSPDGTRIAFQSNRDAVPSSGPRGTVRGYDIYVMTAEGRDVRRLSTTPAGRATLNPAWSPDGRRLVVASTRDGDAIQWGLYTVSADTGSIEPLTHDRTAYGYGHPRWSPDGRLLVFHSNRDGTQQTRDAVELYVIGSDGTGMRRLTNNHEYDGFADW